MTLVVAITCAVVGIVVFLWLWTLREDWATFTVTDTRGFGAGDRIDVAGIRFRVARVSDARTLVVVRRYHVVRR